MKNKNNKWNFDRIMFIILFIPAMLPFIILAILLINFLLFIIYAMFSEPWGINVQDKGSRHKVEKMKN